MLLLSVISPISATATAIAILLSLVYFFMRNRDILPGPTGLPYLGLFTTLTDEKCHLQLQEFGKKYGDLFSFTYCGKLMINLGSAKALREVHVNKSDCFAGRFTDFNMLTYVLSDGVAMANGESWKEQRKYYIQAMKEYGLTVIRDNTAGPIYDSVTQTIEDIHTHKGKPFNVIELLTTRCMAVMKKVLFGDDGISEEDMLKMNEAYAISLDGMTGVKLLLIGPVGKLIFKTQPKLRDALNQHRVMTAILLKTIKKIESSMEEGHPRCIVEDYFNERNKRKQKNDPTAVYFSDKALISTLAQIVGDGILSVAYFIGCFLQGLVAHPEEQDKIFNELMDVVGLSRLPSLDDKSKLPYTTAFMNEVIRTSNFFTLFPSLECTKETTVRGFRIPKGSITVLNIWQSHHDPATYVDPDKFNPMRFVASKGKPREELPVQFGVGKRACSGEGFVMNQAFLFLTSIVKNFSISEPENTDNKSELFLMTGNMELCFKARTEN